MNSSEIIGLIFGLVLLFFLILLGIRVRKLPIKKPFENPESFLKNIEKQKITATKKRIIFLGDSITHALISGDYFDMVRRSLGKDKYDYINAGVNNELVWHVLNRLDEIIKCEPDHIIILIGTNDCNDSRDLRKAKITKRLKGLPDLPTKKLFEQRYNIMIDRLKKETNATIGVLSLPIISEEPYLPVYKRAEDFSKIIKDIAQKKALDYIPLYEKMDAYLKKHPSNPKITFKYQQTMIILGIIKHLVFNIPIDKISKKNNFTLLTDHIHLNSSGARIVADLIIEYLNKILKK